jgi:hypothetical protein
MGRTRGSDEISQRLAVEETRETDKNTWSLVVENTEEILIRDYQ